MAYKQGNVNHPSKVLRTTEVNKGPVKFHHSVATGKSIAEAGSVSGQKVTKAPGSAKFTK